MIAAIIFDKIVPIHISRALVIFWIGLDMLALTAVISLLLHDLD